MRIRAFFDRHFVACLIFNTAVVFGLLGMAISN
jgi:hypothetical protein